MVLPETATKIIAIVSIFSLGAGSGLVAWRLKARPQLFSALNCFGGGVLLAVGVVHIFGDAITKASAFAESINFQPWVPCMFLTGYALVFTAEQLVICAITTIRSKTADDEANSETAALLPPCPDDSNDFCANNSQTCRNPHMQYAGILDKHLVLAYITLLGLSVHSFLAGLALGAATGGSMLTILIAIVAHKGLAGYALGSALVTSGMTMLAFAMLQGLFSVSTPSGIAFGWWLRTRSSFSPGLEGSILALTGGTFVYVTVNEILGPEIHKSRGVKERLINTVCFLVGAAVMAMFAKWT
eukprot:TRINITY_DN107023_c0_g1_i1.p1 TRINITY_DN107023_c0_g1~~TRINITY_DN107023_c0_g1_i1.p1  ORF type:complete len:300 (+),score=17.99 TRINITY_DN107023_c0_g1_i1:40-939(+)